MQIVIDINDKVYGLLRYFEKGLGLNDKKDDSDDVKTALIRAVIHGTPLPKGHGRLIDEERISLSGIHFETEHDHAMMIGRLNSAPTIIEKDKE